jgi:hypothetical protein
MDGGMTRDDAPRPLTRPRLAPRLLTALAGSALILTIGAIAAWLSA